MPCFRYDGQIHVFAHVPKCGGTSVEDYLRQKFGQLGYFNRPDPQRYYADVWGRCSPQHVPWQDFVSTIPQEWIGQVFTVVRHPFDRFASAYNMRSTAPNESVFSQLPPEEFFDWYLRFERDDPYFLDNHFRPQTDFFPATAEVFKLEDGLDQVEAWLSHTFRIPGPVTGMGHNMKTPAPESDGWIKEEMSRSLCTKLSAYYARDFEQLGYDEHPEKLPTLKWLGGRSSWQRAIHKPLLMWRAKSHAKWALRSLKR
ncbi:MAG: sulfotransferase family 2 domain-containing protein [Pseudomonadota bacterium]